MNSKPSIDTRALVREFNEFLHSNGLRLTSERRDILEHIFSAHTHFEAEDLQIRLREAGHRVSKATIYRTLKLLVESGVLRLTMGAPDTASAQYELVHGLDRTHEHLYCQDCGKIIELSNPSVIDFMEKQTDEMGFDLVDLNIRVVGHCRELRANGRCNRSGKELDQPSDQ